LNSRADLKGAKLIENPTMKGWYVYHALKNHAEETQQPIIEFLKSRTDVKSITPFWISNVIMVEAKRSAIDLLRQVFLFIYLLYLFILFNYLNFD